jgi:hypothetical protein
MQGYRLFFSKTSLEGKKESQMHKGTIYTILVPRLIKAIRQFTDKEIIGLPEEMMQKEMKKEQARQKRKEQKTLKKQKPPEQDAIEFVEVENADSTDSKSNS